ncbi:hypothetical protein RHSP_12904 [Rhizobium freirei PRF 81]|uniref:Uncharacterized protein n=1 Tax=Rhizobium freirei PRF 81 TaxID=363754 RepID=N6V7Q0_9HYPH|nr:hypothetical protein RHSP_12904 [Rhizobium freirei PRF 81]
MIATDKPYELALHLDAIRSEDARLIGWIGRFERDRRPLAAEALQCRFFVVYEGNDDIARVGSRRIADDDRIAIENAGIDHRIATYFQRIVIACAKHVGGNAYVMCIVLDSRDGNTSGDPAHDRHGYRTIVIVIGYFRRSGRGNGLGLAKAAFDDARRKAAPLLQTWIIGFRQLDDFKRSGPVRQSADEAALFERCDQPVDSGLRCEIQCVLHLVERWRNTGLFHAFVNEEKQFLLLARQHRRGTPESRKDRETNPERTLYVPYVFRKCLNFGKALFGQLNNYRCRMYRLKTCDGYARVNPRITMGNTVWTASWTLRGRRTRPVSVRVRHFAGYARHERISNHVSEIAFHPSVYRASVAPILN